MSVKLFWAFLILAGAVASAETLGSITSIEEFPSLAQVEFRVGLMWVQQCAASILTNRHVLSIATCFSGVLYLPENRRFRVGTSYRGIDGSIHGVENVILHPDFGLLGKDADIAVIFLDSYLTIGTTVQQVPILGQGIELPFGLRVQLAGWGTTAEGGQVSSANLYSIDLYINDSDSCLEKYLVAIENKRQYVTENMVCVGLGYTRGRDMDPRDLGAPLMYSNTLVGILSFGENAENEFPAVATAVGSYTDWIIASAE